MLKLTESNQKDSHLTNSVYRANKFQKLNRIAMSNPKTEGKEYSKAKNLKA